MESKQFLHDLTRSTGKLYEVRTAGVHAPFDKCGKRLSKTKGFFYRLIRKYFPLYLGDRRLNSSRPISLRGKFCPEAVLDTEDLYSSGGVSLPPVPGMEGRAAVQPGDRGFSRLLFKTLPLDSSNQQKPRYGGLAAPDLLHTLS